MRLITMTALLCALLLGCGSAGEKAGGVAPAPWRGELQVHGALRAMMHEGKTAAAVNLDSMLPDERLFAVGALADLAGEITVVGGEAYLSYPSAGDAARVEKTTQSAAGAALLVAAEVSSWRSVVTDKPILFSELDEAIVGLAASAGLGPDSRFPFLMQGRFEDLQWHVIDGRRLAPGQSSHQDHLAASIQERLDRASATLVGFYSPRDGGVFTHMGSRTHIHCVLDPPSAAGHVDSVVIPAGTAVSFPAGERDGRPVPTAPTGG